MQPAFALDRFDDDGCGKIDAAAVLLQKRGEVVDRIDASAEEAFVRHGCRVRKRNSRARAFGGVAGDRQGSQGHAVEGIGEVQYVLTSRDLTRQL